MTSIITWLFSLTPKSQLTSSNHLYPQFKPQQPLKPIITKFIKLIMNKVMIIVRNLKNLDDRGIERMIWFGVVVIAVFIYYLLNKNMKEHHESSTTMDQNKPLTENKNMNTPPRLPPKIYL
jgi:hypothetical protein